MQAIITRPAVFAIVTRHAPALALLLLGSLMLYGVGFLGTAAVHNAAHNTRHAVGFPCH